MMWFVYYLLDEDSGDLLYVGRSNHPKRRKWAFERKYQRRTTFGFPQRFSSFDEACFAELAAIKRTKPPFNKNNVSSAGMLGRKPNITAQQIEAIKKANTGREPSEKTREKMSQALKGRVFSEEHRRRLKEVWKPRLAMHGRKHSPETRAKMSASQLNRKVRA